MPIGPFPPPRPARWRRAALLGIAAILPAGTAGAALDAPLPYPPSTRVTDMALDWSTYRRDAAGSDNWTSTRAADGSVFASWGDGGGFGVDASRRAYVSIGVAELTGSAARTLAGRNLVGGFAPSVAPCFAPAGGLVDRRAFPRVTAVCQGRGLHGKSWSMLALGGSLHMFVSPGSGTAGYDEGRLYRAPPRSNAWTRASWAFTRRDDPPLVAPMFVQAGRGGADAPFVYAYAARHAPAPGTGLGLQRGPDGGQIYLLRAAKAANLLDRASWEFFAGTPGVPAWSRDQIEFDYC